MAERRQPRKNESIILQTLNQIAVDVAVIKEKTSQLEDHSKALNGKVYNMESRMQSVEGVGRSNSDRIANTEKALEANNSFWQSNWKYIFSLLIMVLLGLLGFKVK